MSFSITVSVISRDSPLHFNSLEMDLFTIHVWDILTREEATRGWKHEKFAPAPSSMTTVENWPIVLFFNVPWKYKVVAKVLENCKKCGWMTFKPQLLKFYQTDSNEIFNIVFACLFYIIILKPISYLSDPTRRKKCWKKGELLRLSADLPFWIIRTECTQNKKWAETLSTRPSKDSST